MALFSDFSIVEAFFRRMPRSLRQTITLTELFPGHTIRQEQDQFRYAVLALIKAVLTADGEPLNEKKEEIFRQQLLGKHTAIEAGQLVHDLRNVPPFSPVQDAELETMPQEKKAQLFRFLLNLAIVAQTLDDAEELLCRRAISAGLTPEDFKRQSSEAVAERQRRNRIIRSGAGILAALIVIAVFILTATLLRSVIFGLIAAYLMLPVEKYFERRLKARKGIGYWLLTGLEKLYSPLTRLAGKISRATGKANEISEKEKQLRFQRKTITQAISLTCIFLLLIFMLLAAVLSGVTRHYVRSWSQSVHDWNQTVTAQPDPENPQPMPATRVEQYSEKLLTSSREQLERLRKQFENLPAVRFIIEQLSNVLKNPDTQQELASMVLRKTGGVFSFTANVLGTIAAICADLLLTVFFFLLFLAKLAEFCQKEDDSRQSEYLVRTVFNGKWLPGASEETIAEARRIINGVIDRLRTYIRGYLTLVLVDSTVYTTCFFFLGVPYFPILGIIAGCGILLPYLGPIISTTLTVLVMLAAGCSGTQLIAVLAAYTIYNGVIEQFILYPAVIGESLGLTALETIIVVLLGAIFAGIPGMLLALPAASVLKFLVPQIYNCFGSNAEA